MNNLTTPVPLWLRVVKASATLLLVLTLTLIIFLAVAGNVMAVGAALEQSFSSQKVPSAVKITLAVTCLLIVLLPAILIFIAARKKWITGRFLLIGWAAVVPVLVWLSWDEPAIRHPVSIEEFSPAFPGAEESYALLMQYSSQAPSEEAKAFKGRQLQTTFNSNATLGEKWVEFLTANREKLETDWATLAPQREWFEQLNAFERFGDLTPADLGANIPTFQIWRTLSQRYCAQAALLALDGKRDEALILLAPMLEAGRKLQPSSRTLVRTMIGVVVEKNCMETAAFILDQGGVSPAARERLAIALGTPNVPALARRLVLIEYVHFGPLLAHMKMGDQLAAHGQRGSLLSAPLNLLSALFVNPNASINLQGDHAFRLAGHAEKREIGAFKVLSKISANAGGRQLGMKNLGGQLMLLVSTPAYDKVIETHWKLADQREALRQRL